MENLLEKITQLEQEHDKLDSEFVEKKKIKLGLRNPDGTGVVAGVTSKGQVVAFKREHGKNIPIPGKLIYCGYDVEDIVADVEATGRFGFEEVVFLLLTGELPTQENLEGLKRELAVRMTIPDAAHKVIKISAENDDQMGALHAAVSILHKFDPAPKSTDITEVTRQCIDLIAKFPALIAYNYCAMRDNTHAEFIEPREDLSIAQNFLYMLHGEVPDDEIAHAFDIALILHAEHGGGNNSTFTVRTVSSSLTDTYMAICAGIASLAGHLHGGANEAVMNMMADIKDHVKDWKDDAEVKAYLEGIMDRKYGDGSGKIYGMGHAVYTISDPRFPILKEKARHFAQKKDRMDEFDLYVKVSDLAVQVVQEKKGRKVCPNVDFFSGFVYDMMNIPLELYTAIFAMSRVSGWAAHRVEEIIQGRLIRPAYISSLKVRKGKYKYIPLEKRK
jgi:citrate synthase